MEVESGKMYLLRIVNAALNDELFFAIAGHNMTVVEIDAVYTKPFTTRAILTAPGQTTNVLVKADQAPSRYFMAARPFMDAPIPVDILVNCYSHSATQRHPKHSSSNHASTACSK